ncbi:MAG TPA: DUF58 domain-containing protein [Clostridia bacterium]|nr:DUF58 domain-containing protein [Clostridia bacterium]
MRNKYLLLSLVITSFIFALFTGGKILYLLFYELSFFVLLNYLYINHIKKSIDVYINSNKEEITIGERINYDINLINNSFLPVFSLKIIDHSLFQNIKFRSEEWHLMPFKNKRVKKNFVISKRGIYYIGPFEIEIKDPFGIFKAVKKYNNRLKFMVFPKIHNITIELQAKQQLGNIEAKNKAFEDYANILQLRKYTHGDSIKKVHWKVSAKKRELYVKEFQVSAMSEAYLLWDLDKNHFREDSQGILDENCAECMVSIAKYCLSNNIPVSLIDYNTGKIQVKGKSIKDFRSFIDASLRNFPVYERSLEDFIKLYRYIPYDVSFILITPHLDNKILGELSDIKNNSRELIVFYVNDPIKIEDKIAKLDIKVVLWGKDYVKRTEKSSI